MKNPLLLYDSFNAKYLSDRQVARSFVDNDEYKDLRTESSNILMGPRGCGKTTLLKMLTNTCLEFWEERDDFNLSFEAVYIPSDIQWKNQFKYLENYLPENEHFTTVITEFLFTSNVLISLCKTFNSIIEFRYTDKNQSFLKEYETCKNLTKSWGLEGKVTPKFEDIELAILERVKKINAIVKEAILKRNVDETGRKLPTYVFEDFFDLIRISCKIFEKINKGYHKEKWALCFDELEIAPKFIQIKVVSFLRSVDQKYIFKLTSTPLFNLENKAIEASQGNDFTPIKLWIYDEKKLRKWQKFCRKLISKRLDRPGLNRQIKLSSLVGEQSIDEMIKDEFLLLKKSNRLSFSFDGQFEKGISKNSSMNLMFKQLAETDETFRKFLIDRKINIKNPLPTKDLDEKTIFLKHKYNTLYRLIYKNRSRRKPSIHYGSNHIFELCDGNPRLVIGLVDEIFQSAKYNTIGNGKISKSGQSQIIFKASEKYFSLIKNHPESTISINNKDFNLAENLISNIGKYFHDRIIEEGFKSNVPSTFIVDENVLYKYVQLLELGLYLGAIVYLNPLESLTNSGIVGKRFRLSHFLAPKYQIPPRTFSSVSLSAILRVQTAKKNRQLEFLYKRNDSNKPN